MNRGMTLALALGGGLSGGLLSRYLAPPPVLAQAVAPREIRAQSLVLVDEKSNVVGTFRSSQPGSGPGPTVVLLDRNGREIWRAGISVKVLSER